MKGKKILIIILILLGAGGAGGFFLFKDKGLPGTVSSLYSEKNPFSGTLKAAVELGVPLKCTYEMNGVKYSGTLKGRQYKGEIQTPDGKAGVILMKDDCMYSWAKDEKEGTKICFEEQDAEDMWDDSMQNTDLNYKCYPTVLSPTEFDVPSDIEIIDLNSLMDQSGVEL